MTADPEEFRKMMDQVEGNSRRVHVDIIDGVFADNKTIDPAVLERIETSTLIDFHLMTKSPESWVERCVRAGAERIIAQIEMMGDQLDFIAKCQAAGVRIGLAIDLNTPVTQIDEAILKEIDVVLVMSVKAGAGGQKFDESCLEKITELAKIKAADTSPFQICVDGGETLDTIDDVVAAGADEVVIGRKLFDGDLEKNIQKFEYAAEQY